MKEHIAGFAAMAVMIGACAAAWFADHPLESKPAVSPAPRIVGWKAEHNPDAYTPKPLRRPSTIYTPIYSD